MLLYENLSVPLGASTGLKWKFNLNLGANRQVRIVWNIMAQPILPKKTKDSLVLLYQISKMGSLFSLLQLKKRVWEYKHEPFR